MKPTEWEDPFANDLLARRLARIQDPPVSTELMARVLSRQPIRRRRRVQPRHIAPAVVGLAALVTALAASPVGAATSRGVIQRFGIMTGAPQTLHHPGPNDCAIYEGAPNTTKKTFTRNGVTITEWTRPDPASCKGGGTLRMWTYKEPVFDLQRAQGLVSFRIRTAGWLPGGLQLEGIGMDPKPPDFSTYGDRATVIYRPPGTTSGPNLVIEEQPGTPNGGSGVPSSSVKRLSVNGHPAVYVHGNYERAVWNPNADVSELSWQADGITFDIRAAGLHLSKSDLLRVAESMQ